MKRFRHINATSLEKAVSALGEYGENARIIAGGTDLLGQMKDGILPDYPEALVNIKAIPGLDYIKEENNTLKIGALTRLEDIAQDQTVREKYPALAEAAGKTASPHIREQGTIAGNICQSNRCWYYWVPDNRFSCLRKGGKQCYAYGGEGRYHSIFGSTRIGDTPCTAECPSGVNIPGYLSKLRDGDIPGAAGILLESNPLPAITGRVCPHFCENACNRGEYDEAVSVRIIERFLGNYSLDHAHQCYPVPEREIGKSVAVIGSGPAGLAAAWYLRKAGYRVTVYEAMEKPGGMLQYGIPPYRLPKGIIEKQVAALTGSGINFKIGPEKGKVGDVTALAGEYDAVFLAAGAWKERPVGIDGEDLMVSGTGFLRDTGCIGDAAGKKVAVMGGGNVAVDVARTLLRLGAVPVILYRRSREEMPAVAEEVERAEEEEIDIQFLTLPVKVSRTGGKNAVTCTRMRLGPPDESGRPRPEPVEGSEFTVDYDAVIRATGEVPDTSAVPADLLDAADRLSTDETGCLSGNIFAGGDCVTGPSTVVQAIAAGRKTADSIIRFLGGTGLSSPDTRKNAAPERFDKDYLGPVERVIPPELPVTERLQSLTVEDVGDLEQDQVLEEANRCFNCGCLAVNSSDIAPVLVALDAKIKTTNRVIEAERLFTADVNASTVLDGEIVTEIEIPAPGVNAGTAFMKFALRKSIDFPVVNCAVMLEQEAGTVTSARICLNAVYNTPYRAAGAEEYIIGKEIDDTAAEEAGTIAVAGVCPLPDNTWKVQIAKTLVKRALLACAGK